MKKGAVFDPQISDKIYKVTEDNKQHLVELKGESIMKT